MKVHVALCLEPSIMFSETEIDHFGWSDHF